MFPCGKSPGRSVTWLVFISVLSLALSFALAPISKAEASVSWGQEVIEVAKRYTDTSFKW